MFIAKSPNLLLQIGQKNIDIMNFGYSVVNLLVLKNLL